MQKSYDRGDLVDLGRQVHFGVRNGSFEGLPGANHATLINQRDTGAVLVIKGNSVLPGPIEIVPGVGRRIFGLR